MAMLIVHKATATPMTKKCNLTVPVHAVCVPSACSYKMYSIKLYVYVFILSFCFYVVWEFLYTSFIAIATQRTFTLSNYVSNDKKCMYRNGILIYGLGIKVLYTSFITIATQST